MHFDPNPPLPLTPHTLLFLMDQMHDRSPTTNAESKPHNKCVHSNKLKAFLSQIWLRSHKLAQAVVGSNPAKVHAG